MRLNRMLIAKQNLTRRDIAKIKKLHKKKNKLFSMVKYWLKKGELGKVVQSGKTIKEIEFAMQEAWNFDKNENKHSHWVYNPACTCPKMDNLDPINLYPILISSCIVHGPELANMKNIIQPNTDLKILLKVKD